MMRDQSNINAKLYELGNKVGLEASEINSAKKTVFTVIGMCIVAGTFALVGMYSSNLEAVGLLYTGVSIKDFSLFSRFF